MKQEYLTDQQRAELEALEQMSDEDIDFSDIPEVTDLSDAIHGAYYILQRGEPLPRRKPRQEKETQKDCKPGQ